MKKLYLKILAVIALACFSFGAKATGWPANYQGVMLQGFYWDSYSDTRWTNLTSKADEYSKYFSLIWVPNAAKSAGSTSMGYNPIYWFTNFSSSFGTEAQLREMIAAYKAKGVGIIEDVVVNHREGVSNWYNFPSETYKGKTYHLTTGSICSTDEVWRDGGHGCPASYKGNPDTGDDFGSSRDLDHTNATVQDNVKNYCKMLIDDLGFVGFRLDMVKGYGGQYTKIYNQYSKPQFCVGEYFDGSYDLCSAWIEATGKESACFDFPFKFAVNNAFGSNDMTKLCWTNPSGAQQPAGLVHYGYQQFAVTFIDNHDTYRDNNKFNGNVVAANAYMLCSPGTPCVFLRHYLDNKAAIQALINVRNQVGVHNMSQVNVLKLTRDCYMAEVTGTKGKLVVRIGSGSDTPSGYSSSDIKCSGTGYCVWATTKGGVTPDNPGGDTGSYPASLYLMGHTKGYEWATDKGIQANGTNGKYTWSNVTIDDAGEGKGYFAFATRLGSSWDEVNSYDRYGAPSTDYPIAQGGSSAIKLYAANVDASGSQSWMINAGTYNITADLSTMTLTVTAPGENIDPTPTPETYPASLYLIGHSNGWEWDTNKGHESKGNKGVYDWNDITFDDADNGYGYFAFATRLGSSWDEVNAYDRYGASSADEPIALGQTSDIALYAANVNASGSQSWKIKSGTYSISADLTKMKITIKETTGVNSILGIEEGPVEFYNLMGVKVENPAHGVFIKVQGGKATKVLIP